MIFRDRMNQDKNDQQPERNKTIEQLPTTYPGDRLVRRERKPRGKFRNLIQAVLRFFKSITNKYPGKRK